MRVRTPRLSSLEPAEKGATADIIINHTGYRSVAMKRVRPRRADAFAEHGKGLL